jgi:hypothetical protein
MTDNLKSKINAIFGAQSNGTSGVQLSRHRDSTLQTDELIQLGEMVKMAKEEGYDCNLYRSGSGISMSFWTFEPVEA